VPKEPLQSHAADSDPSAAPSPESAEAIVELLLERLRSIKPKLAALVSHHNGIHLDGDCLRLGFVAGQQFIREQLEQEEFRGILEKEASEIAGRPIEIEFGFSEPEEARETSPPEETSVDKNALRTRAVADPMVRSFVETFQGEVDEVRALGGSSPTKERSDDSTKR